MTASVRYAALALLPTMLAIAPTSAQTFADGVRYMQFTEAVARSSRHQQPVSLPLTEFSSLEL